MKKKNRIRKNSLILIISMGLIFSSLLPLLKVKAGWNPVTLSKSENAKFPDMCHSTLQFTFDVTASYGDDPQIHYSVDEFRTDPHVRFFYIWLDDTKILDSTISNDKSGIIDVPLLKSYKTHTIKVEIYDGAYGDGCYKLDYLKIGKLFWSETNLDKQAYIFYDSSKTWTSRINTYFDIIDDFGFDCISYKDEADWENKMSVIDNNEDENSIIFICLFGHGYYHESTDKSYVDITEGSGNDPPSEEFATKIGLLESKRILVFVDACESGDFKDELENHDGVSIMTSNDEDHLSRYSWFPRYTTFAKRYIQKYIGDTKSDSGSIIYYDDYYSFIKTRDYYSWSYGLCSFKAWHSFFGP